MHNADNRIVKEADFIAQIPEAVVLRLQGLQPLLQLRHLGLIGLSGFGDVVGHVPLVKSAHGSAK